MFIEVMSLLLMLQLLLLLELLFLCLFFKCYSAVIQTVTIIGAVETAIKVVLKTVTITVVAVFQLSFL